MPKLERNQWKEWNHEDRIIALFDKTSSTEEFDHPAEPSFANENQAAIHQALAQISVKHREVLVLHFLQDLSVEEIASVVGCSPGTVKSRKHHAKQAMKQILQGRTIEQPPLAPAAAGKPSAYRKETAELLAKHDRALSTEKWTTAALFLCGVAAMIFLS